jgi:predicted transcriptional regulator
MKYYPQKTGGFTMASSLLELTAEIVMSHVSVTELSPEDLVEEIKMFYAMLESLERGDTAPTAPSIQEPKKRGRKPIESKSESPAIVLTLEEAFQPDQVACMICGKRGMKTLKRHLSSEHDMKPGQYRKQFNVPKEQPLAASAYVEKRRQMAWDRGLADTLAKAREIRKQKKQK